MAPIRRYLRITKYSVLEVRIYLENPALASSWLLHPSSPVLPRVIESVRPLVLPKLLEEKERARKKSTKKRAIKDTVIEDDFEVAIFLTETNTRHSLLFKHKRMRDKTQTRIKSTGKGLIDAQAGDTVDTALDVDDEGGEDGIELIRTEDGDEIPMLRREDSDEPHISLRDIPDAAGEEDDDDDARASSRKRPRRSARQTLPSRQQDGDDGGSDFDMDAEEEEDGDGDSPLFVDSASDGEGSSSRRRGRKRRKENADEQPKEDDKKKLGFDISYEGFAIYGRVLCLVVKRRDPNAPPTAAASSQKTGGKAASGAEAGSGSGQAMMENWIASTQVAPGGEGAA